MQANSKKPRTKHEYAAIQLGYALTQLCNTHILKKLYAWTKKQKKKGALNKKLFKKIKEKSYTEGTNEKEGTR